MLYRKLTQVISYAVGALEILLGLRFVLQVAAANESNTIASFIFSLSDFFIAPFSRLFPVIQLRGGIVININVLFAMITYLLLMVLVNWLLRILARPD
jgi:uncharacterized protein YggT (Ycf19 family)